MGSICDINPNMLTDNQFSKELHLFVVFTIALVVGASISMNPLIFEFTTNESSDTPIIEEIDGDILDPTHPFQVEKSSEGLKNAIKQIVRIIIPTERALEYVANLPEAGSGPENPNSSGGDFNNESNDSFTENFKSNFGKDSQNPISKNNLSIDLTNNKASVLDKVQSVLEDTGVSFVEYCTNRGPEVKLQYCNFVDANLYGTVLTGADLSDADFTGANLQSAFLKNADLSGTDLTGTNLRYAYLVGANFEGANLSNTDFTRAILSEKCLPDGKPMFFDLNGDNLNDVQLLEYRYHNNWFCITYMK